MTCGARAVRSLAQHFLRRPPAFAAWMGKMARNYVVRCEETGTEPDRELLAPIIEALDCLSSKG